MTGGYSSPFSLLIFPHLPSPCSEFIISLLIFVKNLSPCLALNFRNSNQIQSTSLNSNLLGGVNDVELREIRITHISNNSSRFKLTAWKNSSYANIRINRRRIKRSLLYVALNVRYEDTTVKSRRPLNPHAEV